MKINNIKKQRKILVVSIISIIVIYIIYASNVFGVQEWILESNLFQRLNAIQFIQDSRLQRKYLYIENMMQYPFGGGVLRSAVGGYAHDLLLDVYSDIGIIGFILLIIFLINSVLILIRIIKCKNNTIDFNLLVLCVNIAIFVEFFLEPIIQGVPWMFCAFCFYIGLLKKLRFTK